MHPTPQGASRGSCRNIVSGASRVVESSMVCGGGERERARVIVRNEENNRMIGGVLALKSGAAEFRVDCDLGSRKNTDCRATFVSWRASLRCDDAQAAAGADGARGCGTKAWEGAYAVVSWALNIIENPRDGGPPETSRTASFSSFSLSSSSCILCFLLSSGAYSRERHVFAILSSERCHQQARNRVWELTILRG